MPRTISWLPDPTPFDADAFQAMDRVVESVLGATDSPAGRASVGSARPVWPRLDQAREFLLMDEGGAKRDLYASDWRSQPMFVNVGPEHPELGLIINDPVADFNAFRHWWAPVLVRTRADADTWEARSNDTQRRDAALPVGRRP